MFIYLCCDVKSPLLPLSLLTHWSLLFSVPSKLFSITFQMEGGGVSSCSEPTLLATKLPVSPLSINATHHHACHIWSFSLKNMHVMLPLVHPANLRSLYGHYATIMMVGGVFHKRSRQAGLCSKASSSWIATKFLPNVNQWSKLLWCSSSCAYYYAACLILTISSKKLVLELFFYC